LPCRQMWLCGDMTLARSCGVSIYINTFNRLVDILRRTIMLDFLTVGG
jgi:hypothetical protein